MDRDIALLAETQHGLFTIVQVRELGGTRHAIAHRVGMGRWEEVHPGVYRLVGSLPTWEQRLHGLVLASGPVAAASHRSAAALLRIPGFDRRGLVEVVTPRPRRHRDPDGRVHRWRVLPDHHLTVPPARELEARFRDLVRTAGLPEPVRQLDVGDAERWIGRVDVAYPWCLLLIELDSRRHHTAILDLDADAVRDAALVAAGWRIERI